MYRVRLDEAARQELQRRTRAPGIKRRTRDRLEMVRLSDAGWLPRQIAEHLGVFVGTVRTWLKAFLRAGFDALPDQRHPGPPSALTPAILQAACEQVRQSGRTWTAQQIADWVAQEHGVRVTAGWLSDKMRAAKMSYKRTSRHLKHKQDPEQVAVKRAEKQALEKRGTQANSTLARWTSSASR